MQQQLIPRSHGLLAATLLSLLALLPLTAQADTKVRTSSFEYDSAGFLIKEVIEPGPAAVNDCLETSYTRDAYGNKISSTAKSCPGASGTVTWSATTPRTATSSFGADGRFPVQSSNALGHGETRIFDARFGVITSLMGPNALSTTWVYDGFGRKTRENRSDGTYTTWTYLLCGATGADCPGAIAGATSVWVLKEQSFAANDAAISAESRQYHDTLNRVVRVRTTGYDGAGTGPTQVQDTEYDALGRVARKSQLYALSGGNPQWSSYSYDALGRVISESRPDPDASGGIATSSTSYNGLSTTVTNSKGQSRTTLKNAQGQVAQVTDHQGNIVAYSYDALGQLTQTNAAGAITTLTYNLRGQKVGMVDPAMGAWEYRYNVFGELVWQRDSLSQAVTLAYDVLGRMTQRSEPELISQWSYDKKFDASPCGKGIGKLCEAKADNGYKRVHSYDSLGRTSSTATVLDNPAQPAVASVSYEASTGRVGTQTWPTGYQASYQYTTSGYLKKVSGGGTAGFAQTATFEVLAMDTKGNITQYKQGNQVTTVRNYDDATGRLKSQSATRDGQASGNVLAHTYTHDSLGNLSTRQDNSPGVGTQESFSYDSLNRLNLYTALGGGIGTPMTTEVLYDARGNITYKSDVGRYWYDAARPSRMTAVTLETAPGAQVPYTGTRALAYAFDDYKSGAQTVGGTSFGNGNLMYTVSQDTANSLHTYRGESYTSFNMPLQFTYASIVSGTASTADRTLTFVYGPEHQRIKQQVQLSSNAPSRYSPGTTWYLNGEDSQGLSYEKAVMDSGLIEHKHYVGAGASVFALYTSRTGTLGTQTTTTTSYFHNDHLGSAAAISDETGAVVERMAYDPWGKRRNVNGTPDVLDSIVGWNTDRGYTMHEHLDEMGVIHMNGRIFDPLIGRMMSADPFVQTPRDLQSFSRYAYVLNNPLKATDPSGFNSLEVGPPQSPDWSPSWLIPQPAQPPVVLPTPSLNNGALTSPPSNAPWSNSNVSNWTWNGNSFAPPGGSQSSFTSDLWQGMTDPGSRSVLENRPIGLGYDMGAGARQLGKDLLGISSFETAGERYSEGRYVESTLYGLRGIGELGTSVFDALGAVLFKGAKAAVHTENIIGQSVNAAQDVAKEGRTLFHYTDAAGAKGIGDSGVLRPDAKGRVFLTEQRLSSAEVKDRLFIGRSGEKGSHVIEIQVPADLPIRLGKNPNELIHQGTLRDGRHGTFTVKPNDF